MPDDERPAGTGCAAHGHDGHGTCSSGAPAELPGGIKKDVVTEAPSDGWRRPKPGDEVTVHYVGKLESDGSEFDSSRGRGEPFVFTLGTGQVIKGWDLAVATMKKGEVSKFTIAPEFAYGDAGSPPKIPGKATLIFEVELLSWTSNDDLFGDGGVIKTQLKEGCGWKKPKASDEVSVSLKVVTPDGALIEQRSSMDYTLGSGDLGPLSKACDRALEGMKTGEEASLKCLKEYAYGEERPDGVTIALTLHELYETKDVSLAKDRSVVKKQVKLGKSTEMPKDGAKVKLSVEAATDGSAPLPGFAAKVLEFTAGNGEVCDALECAVVEMKMGERAVLTVAKARLAAEEKLGLKNVTAERVVFTLELSEFEKAKDIWRMSEDEKIEFGTARKEVGTALFKSGRFWLALERYKKVAENLRYTDNFKDKAKAKELKQACELNQAACLLKLEDYTKAKAACDNVLKEHKTNVKALYRRAQAEQGLKNFAECIRDCKSVMVVDPSNMEVRHLLKQAQAAQRDLDRQLKGLFTGMCKALGTAKVKRPLEQVEKGDEEHECGKTRRIEQCTPDTSNGDLQPAHADGPNAAGHSNEDVETVGVEQPPQAAAAVMG